MSDTVPHSDGHMTLVVDYTSPSISGVDNCGSGMAVNRGIFGKY